MISEHHSDALTLLMALGGFVGLLCLWVVYLGGGEQQVVCHTATTEDPIRSVLAHPRTGPEDETWPQ